MRVAFINFGSPLNMKGLMINVHERAKRLQAVEKDFQIDFYLFRFKDSSLFRKLRKLPKEELEPETIIDNITYKNIWISRTLLSYLMVHKFKINVINSENKFNSIVKKLENYDLLISHGYEANYLSYRNFLINNIPYIASWHGSDINLFPFENPKVFLVVKDILENSHVNQFVSKKLLEKSDGITKNARKELLYTGISDLFYKYSSTQQKELLQKFNPNKKIIIGFVGNLIEVKNIPILPLVMNGLKDKRLFELWIIGDGKLKESLLKNLTENDINFKFFGRQSSSKIVELMNCMNFLIIPSLSEGLPRVTIEAMTCGVHVVGSNVGGIPEVISPKNCFELGSELHINIINRIQEILSSQEPPSVLEDKFKWDSAINKILQNINSINK